MKPHLQTPLLICFPLLLLSSFLELDAIAVVAPNLPRPGCKDRCGNVSIPFPFGIGASCFLNPSFEIKCKEAAGESESSEKPFLSIFNIEVMEITMPDEGGTLSTLTVRISPLRMCSSDTKNISSGIDLTGSPYSYSIEDNVFIVEGGPGTAIFIKQSGIGSYFSSINSYQIGFHRQSPGKRQNCFAATLIKSDSMDQYVGYLSLTSYPSTVPVVLYWSSMSYYQPEASHYADPDEPADVLWNMMIGAAVMVCPVFTGPILVLGGRRFTRFIKNRRKTVRRVKFFKLKLRQHQSSNDGVEERTKLFTHKQLNEATNYFNENLILGKGGQGTVFKGMLIDEKIVAIKKPKLMDESQIEQFINEVVILSQINHRNVVKLMGCCLETEVPLLVYEFVPNGTLSQKIHDPDEDLVFSWKMRLRIAADLAGAVAYLHSSSSIPIYHRDIKSSNIMLDDKHRAKVSDFGSSKAIALDQTHLTTLVQGTLGYLDPEYFESNIYTEKSDVYSFGVVLLELLTSKKPIYRTETMEQKSLVTEFFLHIQNSSLSHILDPEVVKEAKEEELVAFVNMAKCCLHGSRRLRPTMKEVAMTLEMIINSPTEVSIHDQQALIRNAAFDEKFLPETTDVHFMSSPAPACASSPLYIDVHPLLHSTM